jgi:hypothetical protein
MKIKLALAALIAAFAAGCAGTARWDEAAFPNQVYYDGTQAKPAQASTAAVK